MSQIVPISFFVWILLSTFTLFTPSLTQTFRLSSNSPCKFEGRVIDMKTGEPLPAASVAIVGTTMGSFTDDSGRFCIIRVPKGIYRLQVSYVGYVTEFRDGIPITDSTTIHIDFALKSWCYSWADSARADIMHGTVHILLSGLVVGNYETPQGKSLTRTYGFEYVSSCTLDPGCAAAYNEVVDKYLEERNGQGWYDRCLKQLKELDASYR